VVKYIELTQGKQAIVDDHWYEYLSKWKWHYNDGYAVRKAEKGKPGKIRMHRIVNNTPEGSITDHKNGDRLDNREGNLRTANHSGNGANYGNVRGYSQYKGVSFNKATRLWRANITVEGETVYLGGYKTEIEAARAYNAKATELHREFAHLNDVPEGSFNPVPANKSSQYQGVSCRRRRDGSYGWFPQLSVYDQEKSKYITARNGTYNSELEAVRAYNELVMKYNYQYGKLHDIEEES